jgi:gamma-glutamylcyclotransferase (GGCT)/AIG2-like uncharacterized protein YtfP
MQAVCGEVPHSTAARLAGYRRYRVSNQIYPAIEPASGVAVDGVLFRNISRRLLKRLDRYEGQEYRRRKLRVTQDNGRQALAWVYLPRRCIDQESRAHDWSAAEFESSHLRHWCRHMRRAYRHPVNH